MTDIDLLRIALLVAGVALVAAIWFFGRPSRPGQGRRTAVARDARVEPSLGQQIEDGLAADAMAADGAGDATLQSELDLFDRTLEGEATGNELGRRENDDFDKIVSLYVAARQGAQLHGPDIVVAAEKAGLVYGHMNVYHRLVEGHPDRGPIFSVANILKPGSFDMANIQSLQTPAIAFFLTLPAPVPALDAWETMLPTAQRMAELLDGVLLDEQRNALGRQRIAHIRDELRAYDRQREAPPPIRPNRW